MAEAPPTWELIAETKEWVGPLDATLTEGEVVLPSDDFEVSVVVKGGRATTWTAPTAIAAGKGVMVGAGTTYPLVAGTTYSVFVRVVDALEAPVKLAAYVKAR